jgi:M6 family metalloprotease domain protein
MLVYHVDYDASLWNSNRVNVQANQQRYEIVPADGNRQTHNSGTKNEFAGDFFPGFKNVTTWSSTSSPAIAWKHGSDNRALYGITIKEPTLNIGFALNDETLVGIVNMNAKRLWNSSNDCYYDLQGKQQSQPKEGCIYVHQGQKVIFYPH